MFSRLQPNSAVSKFQIPNSKFLFVIGIFSIFYFLVSTPAWAAETEFSSSNFKVINPALTEGGGELSSTNFKLIGSIGQVIVGTSSATSFEICVGFLCFPVPPAPAPAPAPAPGGGIIESLLRVFGFPVPFPPPPVVAPCVPRTDLDCDGSIGLRDLSIFIYFAPQPSPNPADFNNDQIVDSRDLSFIFFNWNEQLLAFGEVEERPRQVALREQKELAFIGQPLLAKEKEVPQPPEPKPPSGAISSVKSLIFRVIEGVISFFRSIFSPFLK